LQGRGTVVTGRVEQGTIKTGEDVEILGLMQVSYEVKPMIYFIYNHSLLVQYMDQWSSKIVGNFRSLFLTPTRKQ